MDRLAPAAVRVEPVGRKIRRLLLAILAVALLLAAIAPWLAGLPIVRRHLADLATREMGRRIEIESLEAGWFSGVTLRRIRIDNPGVEFAAAALLDAGTVRLETPLHRLILGGGEMNVVVEDADVRLEEHAGRTNFEDLQRRLVRPAPPAATPRPPAPPLHLTLRRCKVRFTRLLPRATVRPLETPDQDPEVLPAGARSLSVGLEALDVDLSVVGTTTEARLSGRVDVDGRGGTLEANLRMVGADVSGEVTATGLDLAAVEGFCPERLRGKVDLHARGSWPGQGAPRLEVSGSARDFEGRGIAEKWVRLDLLVQPEAGRLGVPRLNLDVASGTIEMKGSGELPLPGASGEASFRLSAAAPLPALFRAAGSDPCEGKVRLSLEGRSLGSRLDVTGDLVAEGVLFRDPALRASGARQVRSRLDLTADLERRSATIHDLTAESEDMRLALRGEASAEVVDLSGSASGDLGRLQRVLEPFLDLPERLRLAGGARVTEFHLRRAAGGDATLRAKAELSGFSAEGLAAQPLRRERVEIDVDAALEEGGDRLVVRAGRLDTLTVSGRGEGLRGGAFRPLEGVLTGTLDLEPSLLRLFDLPEIAGRLELDLKAKPEADGARVGGRVGVRGLRYGQEFSWPEPIDLRPDVSVGKSGVAGGGTVESEGLHATLTDLEAGEGLRARLRAEVSDLARLRRAAPRWDPGPGVELGGDVALDLSVTGEGGEWSGSAAISSGALTARREGVGVRKAKLTATGEGRMKGASFEILRGNLSLPGLGLSAEAKPEGGALRCLLTLPLAAAREIAPDLAPYQAGGTLRWDGLLHLRGGVIAKGAFAGEDLSAVAGDRRWTTKALRLDLDATLSGDRLDVHSAKLRCDLLNADVSGHVEEVATRRIARLDVRADGELARFLPAWAGTVEIRAEATGPLGRGDVPLRLVGEATAERLRGAEAEASATGGSFQLDLLRPESAPGTFAISLHGTAESVRFGAQQVTGFEIDQSLRGELSPEGRESGLRLRATLRAAEVIADTLPINGVRVSLDGSWRRPDAGDLHQLEATGVATFQSMKTTSWDVGAGTAKVTLAGLRATLSELRADVNGGKVTGSGQVDLRGAMIVWDGQVNVDQVAIRESLNLPLAFLVPIFRLKPGGGAGRSLGGTLGGEVRLTGRGTGGEAFRNALSGSGQVRMSGVTVTGSLLLPLLSLRFDRLLLGTPYTFQDLQLDFKVGGGRVVTSPIEIQGQPFGLTIHGSAGLDGSLDYKVSGTMLPIPLRIRGTFDKPKITPFALDIFR